MNTTAADKMTAYAASLTDAQIIAAHAKLNRHDRLEFIAADALSDELIARHDLDPIIDQIADGEFNGTWHELLVLAMERAA